MKKVLATMSRFIFGGFGIAVLALLMSLTYGALQRLFPGNFTNQMWGLVMFDIAAMCWALAFVFQSKSTGQYAAAGIGFVVAFVGTLGMVAAEVMLSGTTLTPEQTAQIGKWMTYGFIIVTAIHAALVYAHHATAPEIHEQINVGVARGEIVTEAITQATKALDENKADLAYSIRNDIISKAKRDLGLIEADPRMPIIPRRYEQAIPSPVVDPYALPCGHTEGARWNYQLHTWECKVCHQAFDLDNLNRRESATRADRPLSQRFRDWVNSLQKPQPTVRTIEQIAQTSNDLVCYQVQADGSRERIWCKVCRDEGKDWLSPTPCEHVQAAEEEHKVSMEVAMNTLRKLMSESPKTEPTYHPVPLDPKAREE